MKNVKPVKITNRLFVRFAFVAIAFALFCISGCDDDDNDNGDDEIAVLGTYTVSSAILTEDTPDPVPADYTGGQGEIVLPEGTDVTPIVFGLLAQAGPCADPTTTAIELNIDEQVIYVCTDDPDSETVRGQWYFQGDDTLVIIINSETLPVPVTLTLENFQLSGNKLTGTLSNFQFFPSATSGLGVQTVTLNVEFTKIE